MTQQASLSAHGWGIPVDGSMHDDPLLGCLLALTRIEQRPRVDTLLARRTGAGTYQFDVRLQGEGETVFLDL